MEARYSFDDHIAKGLCRLNFEFSGYGRTGHPTSEFTVSVSQLSLDKAFKHIGSKKVIAHLLEKIDNQKIQLYKQLRQCKRQQTMQTTRELNKDSDSTEHSYRQN